MKFRLTYQGNTHSIVFIRLFIALILLSASRILLFSFQRGYFQDTAFPGLWTIWSAGLRFDVSALMMLNLPYIFLAALPFPWRTLWGYRHLADFSYFLANILGLAANFIDTAYFPFVLKRLTWDAFSMICATNNLYVLLPGFFYDFRLNFLVFLLFVLLLIVVNKRFRYKGRVFYQNFRVFFLWNLLFLSVWGLVAVIGIRGGLQLKPISIVNAGRLVQPKYSPLVLNAPFSVIKTYQSSGIEPIVFFDDPDEARSHFNPLKFYYNAAQTVKTDNIVIIVMESFSREHSAFLNRGRKTTSFMPFLDSLMQESLTFMAFANGKRSIEAIPAIISGIPSLLPKDFISSEYSANPTTSIPAVLKEAGYYSVFFHGGHNGTMHFDAFARTAGFDSYKGMNEYQGPPAYDGQWGIYDGPYFQYVAGELNLCKQPFMALIFSLSSHHPYNIPPEMRSRYPQGPLRIQQSIAYADDALARFFKSASSSDWFNNTLFIITADHTSEGHLPWYRSTVGQYAIPLIFYKGDGSMKGSPLRIAQQTDIFPSVVHYLNLNSPIVAFGESVFDSLSPAFSIARQNQEFQMIHNDQVILSDGKNFTAYYHLKSDSLMNRNLLIENVMVPDNTALLFKSVLQQYIRGMTQNRLTPELIQKP